MRVKEGNKEQDILDASVRVFAQFGYHDSKMSKIAEVAGIATGSIYRYFDDKESILDRIFSDFWSRLFNSAAHIVNSSGMAAPDKINSLIDLLFDSFSANPRLAIVIINEQPNIYRGNSGSLKWLEKFLGAGEQILIEGQKQKTLVSGIHVKVTRLYIVGGTKYLLDYWAKHQRDIPLESIRANVKQLISTGLKA